MLKRHISFFLFLTVLLPLWATQSISNPHFSTAGFYNTPQLRDVYNFNQGWRFYKGMVNGAEQSKFDDSLWEVVDLPHGLELLPPESSGCINYQGEAWYRKTFSLPAETKGKRTVIYLEAVMGKSNVWINGHHVRSYYCGYLPIAIDATSFLNWEQENVITVCADNSDDPLTPPGKAQDVLDFTYFGGMYRDAWIYFTNDVFLTDPNMEQKVAGGGVFVAYDKVSENSAEVILKADVRNLSLRTFQGKVSFELKEKTGKSVASISVPLSLRKGQAGECAQKTIRVQQPKLWSPASPYLYNLVVKVTDRNGKAVDGYQQRVGIRSIEFKGKEGLFINGKPYNKPLMGANRHQDFALIGHALPNSMHWRDAKKLKDLGMEVIRSAHFPQDPAWMDACDELGLFMILTTPGWQFWNKDPLFEQRVYENTQEMVRRDRNHSCVFLWEPILNETWYPDYFAKKVHQLVDAEYPYPYCYSACDYRSRGREYYDIWYENAINFDRTKPTYTDKKTEHITFLQREWGDCVDDWSSHNGPSRVSLKWGEAALLTQAQHYAKTSFNYISYDAFFRTNKQFVGGCLWHPFDHQRGYHPDPFYGGIMDAYRQPKPSYHMFKSFRSPIKEATQPFETGPYLYIANEMTPFSPCDVTVFSNCDKVVLTINKGGRQLVYERRESDGMPYPPIVFKDAFSYVEDKMMSDADNEKGEKKQQDSYLLAEGYVNGKKVLETIKKPARRAERIVLSVDNEQCALQADGSDKVVIIASVTDKYGQIKRLNNSHIRFRVEGEATLVGDGTVYANPVEVAWGTAPALIQSTRKAGKIRIYAEMDFKGSQRPISGELEIESEQPTLPVLYNPKELPTAYKTDNKVVNGSESLLKLQRENDLLRQQLNEIKLEKVSLQQSQFNTAKEHQK